MVKPLRLFSISGYSGIAIAFLAALAYTLQLPTMPVSVSGAFTTTLLGLNIAAWLIGSYLRGREAAETCSELFMTLANVLLPLNVYWIAFQYVPPFAGHPSFSASLAAGVGLAYYVTGYMLSRGKTFPYFMTACAVALLFLSPFTLGVGNETVVWLVLAFAAILSAAVSRGSSESLTHFTAAIFVVLLAALAYFGVYFLTHPRVGLLLSFFVASGVLFFLTRVSRGLRFLPLLFSFGAHVAWVFAASMVLYYLNVPAPVYLMATAVWAAVLLTFWFLLRGERFAPCNHTAYLLSMILGLGVAASVVPFWQTLADLYFRFPLQHLLDTAPPPVNFQETLATPLALILVGATFLAMGALKRRYPTIAYSAAGLGLNLTLGVLTSYLPPFLFLAVIGWGIGIAGGPPAWTVVGLILPGALYLYLGHRLSPRHPLKQPLQFFGYGSLLVASVSSLYSGEAAVLSFFAMSLICLVLSQQYRSILARLLFLGFLISTCFAAFMRFAQNDGLVEGFALKFFFLYLVILVACWNHSQEEKTGAPAPRQGWEVLITVGGGNTLAVFLAGVLASWDLLSPLVFLLIPIGFILVTRGWEETLPEGATEFRDALVPGAFVAYGSIGLLLILILKRVGLPAPAYAPVVAGLAVLYALFAWSLEARASLRTTTQASRYLVHTASGVALLLAAFHASAGWPSVVVYLVVAALYLGLRLISGREIFGHLAAWAGIGAVSLIGITSAILLPEFYLTPVAVYLSAVLYRNARAKPADREADATAFPPISGATMKKYFGGIMRSHWLPFCVLLTMLVSPLWALLQTGEMVHIFFLSIGAVLVLDLFLLTHQSPFHVYVLSALLSGGVLYSVVVGALNFQAMFFLVLFGSAIPLNLLLIRRHAFNREGEDTPSVARSVPAMVAASSTQK